MIEQSNHGRRLAGACAVSLWMLMAAPSAAQAPDAPLAFDIAAQPLGDALIAFSNQSNIVVVAPSRLVAGKTAPAVRGQMVPTDALETLLDASGLGFSRGPAGDVRIVRATPEQHTRRVTPVRLAQTRTPPAGQPDTVADARAEQMGEVTLEEMVVTGTNIRGANPRSSPVVVIGAMELRESGFATIGDYLEFLPQNFANFGDDGFPGGFGSDGPAINLRGLGANETLVLINSRRVASSTTFGSFVDLSQIPVTAVERLEILLDGASAVYGADAVAGVVNIILKRDADGLMINARHGTVTDGGLEEYRLSATGGLQWASGGVTVSYEYFDRSDLSSFDRDFVRSPAEFDLIPGEVRHSVAASGEQALADALLLTFDGLVSFENSQPNQSSLGLLQNNDIDRNLYWFGLGLSGTAWGFNYDVQGSFSRRDNDIVNTSLRAAAAQPRRRDFRNDTSIYTVDARVSRPLLSLPGGDLVAGVGGGARRQAVKSVTVDAAGTTLASTDESRLVTHLFGELILPLVGDANALPLVDALEVNLSVRHEDFEDIGASTNPKVGVAWSPFGSLTLRGSYGTSFRAPELRSVSGRNSVAVLDLSVFGLDQPFPELGDNIAVFWSGANPDLSPQEARSFSIGADYRPDSVAGLHVSLNYFDIDYDDRIDFPSNVLGFPSVFFDPRAVGFYTVDPALEDVTRIISQSGSAGSLTPLVDLDDPSTFGVINLVLDSRSQNISRSSTRGLDIDLSYSFPVGGGDLRLGLASVYLFENAFAVTRGSALVDNVDTFGNPVDFQFRASAGYSRGGFSSNVFVNYTDGYDDNQNPDNVESIDSWVTVDLSFAYEFQRPGLLDGLGLRLSVQNLFDNDPPFVDGLLTTANGIALGYDPANASPRGRFIAFDLSKQF